VTKHPAIQAGDVVGRIRVLGPAGYIRGHRTGWACECVVCGQELKIEAYQIRTMGDRPCRHNPNAKPRKNRAAAKPTRQPPPIKKEREADLPLTKGTLAVYEKTRGPVRDLADAMIRHRVRVARKYKLAIDWNRLYIEAVEIARLEVNNPPAKQERYAPARNYGHIYGRPGEF